MAVVTESGLHSSRRPQSPILNSESGFLVPGEGLAMSPRQLREMTSSCVAVLVVFDVLKLAGSEILDQPLAERRRHLEALPIMPTPTSAHRTRPVGVTGKRF